MGAFVCVPQDQSIDGQDGGVTPGGKIEEQIEQGKKKIEELEREQQKRDERIAALEAKNNQLKNQLEENHSDLKKDHHQKLQDVKKEYDTSHNDLRLQLNQEKQKVLRNEASANLYQKKLRHEKDKHIENVEQYKSALEKAETNVFMSAMLTKIRQGGSGNRVPKFVMIFANEEGVEMCTSDKRDSEKLTRVVVDGVSEDHNLLQGKKLSVPDRSKLLIVSAKKKHTPFICASVEQRDQWLEEIQKRLPNQM